MMDLSLDEIIKKKFTKGPQKGKGELKRFVQNNANRRGGAQQKRGVASRVHQSPKIIGDARNRIIQKNRLKLTDAREKLGELAKKTDARVKLQKLRETRMGRGGMSRDVGNNGVLSLNTNKKINRGGARGGGMAGRGRGGLSTSVSLKRTINQTTSSTPWYKQSAVPSLMEMDVDVPISDDVMVSGGGMALRRTVNNYRVRSEPLIRPSKMHSVNSSPYTWTAPQQSSQSVSRTYADLDYPVEDRKRLRLPSPPPMMRTVADDEGMGEPLRLAGRSGRVLGSSSHSGPARMSMDMKSRLDVQTRVPQHAQHQSTSSSLPQTAPSGYRIVVSNLQPTVTHEDIRELFEDVGPLQTSRLVRPGTAEVVYRQYKDAVRAVENYHNRQLDGQPMKCLLVKPRPSTSTAAPLSTSSVRQPSGGALKLSGSGKSSVVPDITTIHKALFNKS